jgi:predicted Zn-dependent protease
MNRSRIPLSLLLFAVLFPARAQTQSETIVPPSDQVSEFDARQELARVFRKLGKAEAAEVELRKLLRIRPNDPFLLADLADLEASRGHFVRSRDLYEEALSKSKQPSGLRLRYARQAWSWGDFYLAEKVLRAYVEQHPKDIEAALDLAGVLMAEQQYQAAEVQYRSLAGEPRARQRALIGLANSRLLEQDFQAVLPLADELLATDPHQVEALTSRAEALRRLHRYDDAKEGFRRLTTLPGGRFSGWIGLGRIARAQKDEGAAERYFRRAQELNPKDIRIRYLLGNEPVTGRRDQTVRQALDRLPSQSRTPYEKYEEVRQLVDSGQLSASSSSIIDNALSTLEPVYRLQKAIWLEREAKWLEWNKKFLQSAHVYRELLALQPGNEEARFDLAQVKAAQGLSLESAASYHELLELDPLHNLASQALERDLNILQHPAIFSKYTYWDEKGIGRASDIQRQQFQSGIEVIWNSQTQLRVSGDYWYESPGSAAHADAAGVTLGFRTVFNEYWRASGEWSHKEYFQSRYDNTETGNADLTFNAWDYAHLTLQYARIDELHNEFGLQQGVQSDNVGLLADSNLNHYVDVKSGVV